MQCVQSCRDRLIFHTAVFRHLSLKIMAAIKHFPAFFPALFWCVCLCVCVRRFPSCRSRHTLPFFAVTFPLISASVFCLSPTLSLSLPLCVYQIWFAAISLLFSDITLCTASPSPAPEQLLVLCPLMFGNLFECQQLFLWYGGGTTLPESISRRVFDLDSSLG